MGARFRRIGLRVVYDFSDEKCIEARCWVAGMYQHRGATCSGSRNTGSPDSPCCLTRAYHGCPQDRGHDPAIAKERRADGWRRVR